MDEENHEPSHPLLKGLGPVTYWPLLVNYLPSGLNGIDYFTLSPWLLEPVLERNGVSWEEFHQLVELAQSGPPHPANQELRALFDEAIELREQMRRRAHELFKEPMQDGSAAVAQFRQEVFFDRMPNVSAKPRRPRKKRK